MLSIVATPIGNLGDITVRAMDALQTCDAIVCEDTRVTGQLLKLLGLEKKPLVSFHGYSDDRALGAIVERLKRGEHLCLVSDAGTPGISDPGYALVSRCAAEGIPVGALPGPAAFLAALSASGLPINRFRYLGFLPLKKGRKTLLGTFAGEEDTIVFYESVHRIEKTLDELADALAAQPDRPIVLARELTKLHEEIVRVPVSGLADAKKSLVKKGEFVVIVGPVPRKRMHGEEDEASM
jgi:16S rRNA (cytidine1402-2'-O)-methyltransferase